MVYDKAIRDDGSLFFPERLTPEFLDTQRRILGSYIFANQLQNEILPPGEQDFKPEWIEYYDELPDLVYTFAFVDPAISLADSADFTALVVVHVDEDNTWYLEVAKHMRITATDTVRMLFNVAEYFKPSAIGVEDVAYQKALLHFTAEEMRRRKHVIPLKGVGRGPSLTKEMRIRSLVPRFEWGRIKLSSKPGAMDDFIDEYNKFPRGAHDDIIDALASIEQIAHPPVQKRREDYEPAPNNAEEYEKLYIKKLGQRAKEKEEEGYEGF